MASQRKGYQRVDVGLERGLDDTERSEDRALAEVEKPALRGLLLTQYLFAGVPWLIT